MWTLNKMMQVNLFTKQKHPQTWRMNLWLFGRGEGGREGMVRELGMDK